MKALLNLFVESAANDQATYIEWKNMSVVNRTATSEQSWRRKEPTPRRKQSTQAKQLTARNKNALAPVTLKENKITPNRTCGSQTCSSRQIKRIKVAVTSYYSQYFVVIAQNIEQHCGFGSALTPRTIAYYPWEGPWLGGAQGRRSPPRNFSLPLEKRVAALLRRKQLC